VLAVGTSQKDYVSLYTIRNSPGDTVSRTPLLTIPAPGGVKFLSWQGTVSDESAPPLAAATASSTTASAAPGGAAQKNGSSPPRPSIAETLFASQREQRMPQTFSGAGIAQLQLATKIPRDQNLPSEESRHVPVAGEAQEESEISKNRLLIGSATMDFFDVIVRESQPLAVSALDTVVWLLASSSSATTFPSLSVS
jgi:hypothetical protein